MVERFHLIGQESLCVVEDLYFVKISLYQRSAPLYRGFGKNKTTQLNMADITNNSYFVGHKGSFRLFICQRNLFFARSHKVDHRLIYKFLKLKVDHSTYHWFKKFMHLIAQ